MASVAVEDEDDDVVILLEVDTKKLYRTFELIFIHSVCTKGEFGFVAKVLFCPVLRL